MYGASAVLHEDNRISVPGNPALAPASSIRLRARFSRGTTTGADIYRSRA
jgi:hypothetical protein